MEWCKTETKVITLPNHNRRKELNEPIRTRNISVTGAKRGKTRASEAWFRLDEKMARVLLTNQSTAKQVLLT